MSFQDKNVVITGASRGLGRALARELGARGARIVMVARHEAELEQAAIEIAQQGIEAHALPGDVGDPAQAARIAGAASALAGDVDVLIHNASTLGPVPLRPLTETSDEDFERALAVNLSGPFRLTRALVGQMIARGRGVVLHVSSDAAVEAYPSWGAYGASKAALDHLSRVLAKELEGTGVRVLSVDPGEMDTRMHEDALPDADKATLLSPSEVAARIARLLASDTPSGSRVAASLFGEGPGEAS